MRILVKKIFRAGARTGKSSGKERDCQERNSNRTGTLNINLASVVHMKWISQLVNSMRQFISCPLFIGHLSLRIDITKYSKQSSCAYIYFNLYYSYSRTYWDYNENLILEELVAVLDYPALHKPHIAIYIIRKNTLHHKIKNVSLCHTKIITCRLFVLIYKEQYHV